MSDGDDLIALHVDELDVRHMQHMAASNGVGDLLDKLIAGQ